MSAADRLEPAGEELPPLAELEEDQQTPSARQRAQRSLPLNRRRAWSSVIEGQVLDVLALEQRGESRHGGRRADGRPRGLAALIPEAPASGPPAAPLAPRAPTVVSPAGGTVREDLVLTVVVPAELGEVVRTPPEHLSILQAVTTPRVIAPLPDGLAPASERLAHSEAGWCACEGLPGHHRIDVAALDVHQLTEAQRFWTITAPTGGVLFTLCDQMTPKVTLQTTNAELQRCRECDSRP